VFQTPLDEKYIGVCSTRYKIPSDVTYKSIKFCICDMCPMRIDKRYGGDKIEFLSRKTKSFFFSNSHVVSVEGNVNINI